MNKTDKIDILEEFNIRMKKNISKSDNNIEFCVSNNKSRPTCYKLSDYIDSYDFAKELLQTNILIKLNTNCFINSNKLLISCLIDRDFIKINKNISPCKYFYYVKDLLNGELYYISANNIEIIFNQINNDKLNSKLNSTLESDFIIYDSELDKKLIIFIKIFQFYINNNFDMISTILDFNLC